MSYFKNESGGYETDIRLKGRPRVRVSLETKRGTEAASRYAAVLRLVKENRPGQIDDLRAGRIRVEELVAAAAEERGLATLGVQAAWPTVDEAADAYVAWLEANPNRSKRTRANAKTHLKRFREFTYREKPGDAGIRLGGLRLDRVTVAMTTAFQQALIDAETPVNSLTSYMTRVVALYHWQQRQEARAALEGTRLARTLHVPIDGDVRVRGTSRREVWLDQAQADALLAATPVSLRAFVGLGLFAGLRVSEVLHLRPGFDVDLVNGLLFIREHPDGWKPKTKKGREVPIADDLRPLLAHHLAHYASATRCFPAKTNPDQPWAAQQASETFRRIVEDAGLPTGQRNPKGVVYHSLRHTFASTLVMRGVDLYTVSQLLGNSLKMIETVYGHLSPDHRRRAVERLAGAFTVPPLP